MEVIARMTSVFSRIVKAQTSQKIDQLLSIATQSAIEATEEALLGTKAIVPRNFRKLNQWFERMDL